MGASERGLLAALLRAGLSADGYARIETVRSLENVLREVERGQGPVRDPELYYVTLFGDPAARGEWGLRFEGHHVSLHWTVRDGRVIGDTPQFLGANPAEVRHGAMRGTRVLAAEEDLAYRLIGLLPPDQRAVALVSPQAPGDILTEANRKATPLPAQGVTHAVLDKRCADLLLSLIRRYAEVQSAPVARARVERVRTGGLEHVRFAWMGATQPGSPHYYRIQGPTFLAELDSTQNDANHVHTVWRDFDRDFGRDLLAEHYQAGSHG